MLYKFGLANCYVVYPRVNASKKQRQFIGIQETFLSFTLRRTNMEPKYTVLEKEKH